MLGRTRQSGRDWQFPSFGFVLPLSCSSALLFFGEDSNDLLQEVSREYIGVLAQWIIFKMALGIYHSVS